MARARACVRDYVREDVLLRYLAPLSIAPIVHVSHVPFCVELRENQDLPRKEARLTLLYVYSRSSIGLERRIFKA